MLNFVWKGLQVLGKSDSLLYIITIVAVIVAATDVVAVCHTCRMHMYCHHHRKCCWHGAEWNWFFSCIVTILHVYWPLHADSFRVD